MILLDSSFLVALLGLNICLMYSVYPLALLGRLSVAPVGFMAIGAYASAYFTTRNHPLVLGILVGIALASIAAVILSLVAGHLRSHFFTAASLGFVLIVQQAAFSLDGLTNGYMGISAPADLIEGWHALLFAGICIGGAVSLRFAATDRIWRSIGTDDRIAGALGIDVRREILIAGIASAAIAAVAGAFYAHIISFFDPNVFGMDLVLQLAAAAVVGGAVNWYGPLAGALVLTLLPELLNGFGPWREAVFGLILVASVTFLPRGLSDSAALAALGRAFVRSLRRS